MDDRRIEIGGGRRIGNPRPVGEGRVLREVPASGNGVVSDVRTRIEFTQGLGAISDTQDPPPFYPISIVDNNGSYECTLFPGSVGAWNPVSGSDTLAFFMPTLNGEPLDASPEPPTVVIGPDEWVCCKIEVDGKNQIKDTPTIVVGEADGTHYIPEAGDTDAEDGTYYVRLFQIRIVDDIPVPDHRVWSDIILSPYLWEGVNVGGGVGRVLKDFLASAAHYRFRTIGSGYGVEVVEAGDTIKPKFLGENVGSGAEIYVDPEDPQDLDPAQFRRLAPKASQPQIQVRARPGDDKTVEVVGNNQSGNLILTKNGAEVGRLPWDDGLVTVSGDIIIELCCDSGTEAPGP